jgi:hypothetical protein
MKCHWHEFVCHLAACELNVARLGFSNAIGQARREHFYIWLALRAKLSTCLRTPFSIAAATTSGKPVGNIACTRPIASPAELTVSFMRLQSAVPPNLRDSECQ